MKVSDSDNTYTLRSVVSGRLLSASGETSGSNVWQSSDTSSSSQWIAHVSEGLVTFSNRLYGLVLDIEGANKTRGSNLQIYSSNGTSAQRFRLTPTAPAADGYYVMRFADDTSQVLDMASASIKRGTRAQSYASNGTSAQKWHITRMSDGTYEIANANSGLVLDVSSGQAQAGQAIQQWTSNDTRAQRWQLRYTGGSATFELVSALDNTYVLSVGSPKNGAAASLQKRGKAVSSGANIGLSSTTYDIYSDLTGGQARVRRSTFEVPSPGGGLCSEWVSQVFDNVGYGYAWGDADDLYYSYCNSANLDELKVGMVIATSSHPHTRLGSIYGHIGIYIGNNTVIQNVGAITTRDLTDWISYYGATHQVRWGWYRHIALA